MIDSKYVKPIVRPGELVVGKEKGGVARYCTAEQLDHFVQLFLFVDVESSRAVKAFRPRVILVGDEVSSWFLLDGCFFCRRELAPQLSDNFFRQLAFNREDVREIALIVFRPKMGVGASVD